MFARFAPSISYVISEFSARAVAITLVVGNWPWLRSSGFAPGFTISIEKFNIEGQFGFNVEYWLILKQWFKIDTQKICIYTTDVNVCCVSQAKHSVSLLVQHLEHIFVYSPLAKHLF